MRAELPMEGKLLNRKDELVTNYVFICSNYQFPNGVYKAFELTFYKHPLECI